MHFLPSCKQWHNRGLPHSTAQYIDGLANTQKRYQRNDTKEQHHHARARLHAAQSLLKLGHHHIARCNRGPAERFTREFSPGRSWKRHWLFAPPPQTGRTLLSPQQFTTHNPLLRDYCITEADRLLSICTNDDKHSMLDDYEDRASHPSTVASAMAS